MKIKSFGPIVDENSKILILGSIPGVESLNKQQYYGNARNQFWKIIFSLFDKSVPEEYKLKKEFLLEHEIGLWDVISDCFRQGSLDSNIKEAEVNDFKGLFETYPNIKHVFFNGSKAYETFKRKVGFENYPNIIFYRLPSTSPAYIKSFDEKFNEWKIIKEYLDA